uniref:CCHC-type domain-containing protein n=1 Tax=Aegilops tauschii subsp. strangulata TaxID=200361 RepID=A0A453FAX2_AEGTS|nr:uncharacterized protein LOC120976756 [Aegilops tauschii subsp. strangulata]
MRQFQYKSTFQTNLPPTASNYQQKSSAATKSGGGGDSDIQTSKAIYAGGVLNGNQDAAGGGMENKQHATNKIICHKCGEKGHNSKGCEAKVKCSITHIAELCAWLHQKKPVASLVGFGGEGLGIFVADHAKELPGNNNNDAVALVRLRDDCDLEIDSEDLINSLAKTYPWRWDWKAKKVSDGVFLLNFPSVARINEAAIYDWVPLKGGNIMIKVKVWNDDAMAIGKLALIWVSAKGVPKTMKNYQGLCEIGSMIGYVQIVDVDLVNISGLVKLKIAVVDHTKIPRWTKLTTPNLMVYRIFFEVEEVLDEGWTKLEDELSQGYEQWMDFQHEEDENREAKKAKKMQMLQSVQVLEPGWH